ncbi:MAG: hypothetical protein CL605_13535, partial [Altibacter sp.]|uniref:hypothetical protein n=1 Tax=Altibacter sp. TaxID=2024823 RepID=UPI000C8A0883
MLDQNDLNKEMTQLGISRYNSLVESAREQEQTGRTRAGQKLIRELLPNFAAAISGLSFQRKTKNQRWISDIKSYDPKKTAFLVLKTALDTFPQKRCTFTSMSYAVGKVI